MASIVESTGETSDRGAPCFEEVVIVMTSDNRALYHIFCFSNFVLSIFDFMSSYVLCSCLFCLSFPFLAFGFNTPQVCPSLEDPMQIDSPLNTYFPPCIQHNFHTHIYVHAFRSSLQEKFTTPIHTLASYSPPLLPASFAFFFFLFFALLLSVHTAVDAELVLAPLLPLASFV